MIYDERNNEFSHLPTNVLKQQINNGRINSIQNRIEAIIEYQTEIIHQLEMFETDDDCILMTHLRKINDMLKLQSTIETNIEQINVLMYGIRDIE